jgi:hypothetical protein
MFRDPGFAANPLARRPKPGSARGHIGSRVVELSIRVTTPSTDSCIIITFPSTELRLDFLMMSLLV